MFSTDILFPLNEQSLFSSPRILLSSKMFSTDILFPLNEHILRSDNS